MEEQLISYETAKLAKEKGFRELYPTTDYIPMYVEKIDGTGELTEQQGEDDDRGDFYLAVTQSLLQKWLREKHNIHIEIRIAASSNRYYTILFQNGLPSTISIKKFFDSYEEALELALFEALKLIKSSS